MPLLAVAGCGLFGASSSEDVVCTMIGGESGVSVGYEAASGTTYRLCVGATLCEQRTNKTTSTQPSALRITLPDPVGAKKVSVRFTATPQGSDKPTVDERAEVTLRKSQPNGPQCPPTIYGASLDYEPGTGLVQQPA